MKQTIFIFLAFFILLFRTTENTLAVETPQKTEVNHVANVVEKLQEKLNLFLKFSKDDKADYQKYLVEKRLAELKYVIDTKQGNLVEETTSRYTTYLGNYSSFVIKNKLINKKENILSMYNNHQKILEQLQNAFEPGSVFQMLLQHDINTIKLFSTQIKDNL